MDIIRDHCRELDACNQRGGRMLSVFDLMAAGTLDLGLAAYLMARISRGASFLVGAMPGAAGKTTVMCALLNLLPAEVVLTAATPEVLYGVRGKAQGRRFCYICHEIGSGAYYAYLWGGDLHRYFGHLEACRNFLKEGLDAGTRTIEQARRQVLEFLAGHP